MKRFALKHITNTDADFPVVCELENRVFMRAFKNSPALMEKEYGPYRDASEFIAVYDNEEKRYAGFMRIIRHSHKGLKSLNDLESAPWGGRSIEQVLEDTGLELERDKVLDIATLGVELGYRSKDSHVHGALVSSSLYHGLIRYSMEHDIAHWVAVLDDKVLAVIQGLGANFQPYTGVAPASYLDSPSSTPVWCHIPTLLETANPFRRQLFVHGHGIKHLVDMPSSFRHR
jgi:hypothetical protein